MQSSPALVIFVALFFIVFGLIWSLRPGLVTRLNSKLFDAFGLEEKANQAKSRSQVVQARIAGLIMLALGIYLTSIQIGDLLG